jgi:hypothetical protein
MSESVRGIDYPFREPKMAVALAPLQRAPLRAGAKVLLVLPDDLAAEQTRAILFEAAWKRPDIHWSLPGDWPPGVAPGALVTVASAPAPLGWWCFWRGGLVGVWGPSPP